MARKSTAISLPKPQVVNGYSPKEAALILGGTFDGKKIRRLLRKGSLKGSLVGGRWYIPATALRALKKKSGAIEEIVSTPQPKVHVSTAEEVLAKIDQKLEAEHQESEPVEPEAQD